MILNAKAKEDFYSWYWNEWFEDKERNHYQSKEQALEHLQTTDKVFLNAIIIEWFDSAGIWSDVINDTLILDKDYFKKCTWQSNIELLIITARDIYNETFK